MGKQLAQAAEEHSKLSESIKQQHFDQQQMLDSEMDTLKAQHKADKEAWETVQAQLNKAVEKEAATVSELKAKLSER